MCIVLTLAALFYLGPLIRFVHLIFRMVFFLSTYKIPLFNTGQDTTSVTFLWWFLYVLARFEYVIHSFRFYVVGVPVVGWGLYLVGQSLVTGQVLDVRIFVALLAFITIKKY